MNYQRGSSDWIGLVVFLVVIVSQALKAMRRGKVEPMPPPRPAPQPAYRRPDPVPSVPVRTPAPAVPLPPKLKDLFDSLSIPGSLPPGVPRPGSAPVPRYESRPAPAPLEASLPPEPTEAELMAEALREVAAEESRQAAVPAAARHGAILDRLRLQGREDWKRAILLSEILQPPLALR